MRLAILSDIHSNLEALDRALAAIDEAEVDAIYCLGDVVGYNADPAVCVDRVREYCDGVVLGNHDAAVARKEQVEVLPPDGQQAVHHNRAQLSDEQLDFLRSRPLMTEVENCTLVHATPDAPAAWKRLTTYPDARKQFEHFDTDVCFVGHTHVPAIMSNKLGVLQMRPGYRFITNVGSVGQPRDQNSKLSFGLFDTESFDYENVRLEYDVSAAAQKIRNTEQLPDTLADRLLNGN